MAAVDLVGLDAKTLAGVAARPCRAEHPIVAAERVPGRRIGPAIQRPRLAQRPRRLVTRSPPRRGGERDRNVVVADVVRLGGLIADVRPPLLEALAGDRDHRGHQDQQLDRDKGADKRRREPAQRMADDDHPPSPGYRVGHTARVRPPARRRLVARKVDRDGVVSTEVHVKHENHQPIGAFKVRGGVNLVAQLSDDERERGLIARSTGNHGQSLAFAARRFGVAARHLRPETRQPGQAGGDEGPRRGADVDGADFDEARENAERLAAEHGYRYVHSGDEPHLIAGVATETLEILEEQPDVDVVIVPVGGGSGAAGACIAAKAINPAIAVIAVQSDAAPAAYRSWKEGAPVEDACRTSAEGLATRTSFALPQQILREHLDDFVLVGEEQIRAAQRTMIEATRNLVEAAGAAPLAAALELREQLRGRRVALVASGGNVSPAQLLEVLA